MTESPSEKAESPAESPLQGQEPPVGTPAELAAAVELAFDYRGDVTLQTADGQVFEGYIFDRRHGEFLRLIPRDSDEMVKIAFADIIRLQFSGKDTAAGKSWETWVKQYEDKKQRGEDASLHPETLE